MWVFRLPIIIIFNRGNRKKIINKIFKFYIIVTRLDQCDSAARK